MSLRLLVLLCGSFVQLRIGGHRGARGELQPVPFAAGRAALDPGVEVLGYQRGGPEEEAALGQQPMRRPFGLDQFRRGGGQTVDDGVGGLRGTSMGVAVLESRRGWSSRVVTSDFAPLCGPSTASRSQGSTYRVEFGHPGRSRPGPAGDVPLDDGG